ncbi:MAG: helix-turn-helix domain-containing protein, partial [Acidithiobacillus sp.]
MSVPHHYRRTLGLEEAADFLKVSKETLRRKAARGEVRGAKPGKCWAFLEDDLVAYLQSLYPENQVMHKPEDSCSTKEEKLGGSILPLRKGSELDDLLAHPAKLKPRNSM